MGKSAVVYQEILDLKSDIKELERKAANQEKKCELLVEEAKLEKEKQMLELKEQLAGDKSMIENLKARIDESPYKLLQEMLKALVVKFPTMDLKELSIMSKGKD